MTPPPIYTHAVNLYNAFFEASQEASPQDAENFGVPSGARLFVGHWSTTFVGRTDLPGESTQQKAYAWLQSIGCLEVLRRGGRDYPGVILVSREPTPEDIKNTLDDPRTLRNGKLGVVETAVQAHTGRIANLEEAVDALNQQQDVLIRDVELQLRKLSARMDEALADKEKPA